VARALRKREVADHPRRKKVEPTHTERADLTGVESAIGPEPDLWSGRAFG
jgi:hypothetical protein